MRWPNLVRASVNNVVRWVLIDMEMAGRVGRKCDVLMPHWRVGGGNVLVGECFMPRSDLLMVASELCSDLRFQLSPAGVAFQTALQGGQLLTATDALNHAWFNVQVGLVVV